MCRAHLPVLPVFVGTPIKNTLASLRGPAVQLLLSGAARLARTVSASF
ncbi:hypothetical protein D8I24_7146 [Cupriavidus necator H850]|nr:hypothetical protein D8I24_7146 [Cupriavidus necator H850]